MFSSDEVVLFAAFEFFDFGFDFLQESACHFMVFRIIFQKELRYAIREIWELLLLKRERGES